MTRWSGGGTTAMLTACVTAGLTLSVSDAVNVAVAVPCPPVTDTVATPVPGVADQLYTAPSSLPVRLTVNGAAFCATLVIGFAGALIEGGLFTAGALTLVLTSCVVAGVFTLSESDAVNFAVPLKPVCSVTVKVAVDVPWPPVTETVETPA